MSPLCATSSGPPHNPSFDNMVRDLRQKPCCSTWKCTRSSFELVQSCFFFTFYSQVLLRPEGLIILQLRCFLLSDTTLSA